MNQRVAGMRALRRCVIQTWFCFGAALPANPFMSVLSQSGPFFRLRWCQGAQDGFCLSYGKLLHIGRVGCQVLALSWGEGGCRVGRRRGWGVERGRGVVERIEALLNLRQNLKEGKSCGIIAPIVACKPLSLRLGVNVSDFLLLNNSKDFRCPD